MWADKDVLLTEYNALRDEIIHNDKLIVEIFTFSVIATSGIIGYAVASDLPYRAFLFLAPVFILFSTCCLITSLRLQIIRLGAYISVFIEEKLPDLNYETAVKSLAKEEALPLWRRLSLTSISIFYAFLFAFSWLSFAIFFNPSPINISSNLGLSNLMLVIIFIVIFKMTTILFSKELWAFIKAGDAKDEYYLQWEKIKNKGR